MRIRSRLCTSGSQAAITACIAPISLLNSVAKSEFIFRFFISQLGNTMLLLVTSLSRVSNKLNCLTSCFSNIYIAFAILLESTPLSNLATSSFAFAIITEGGSMSNPKLGMPKIDASKSVVPLPTKLSITLCISPSSFCKQIFNIDLAIRGKNLAL